MTFFLPRRGGSRIKTRMRAQQQHMQDHILFSGEIAGGCAADHYLKARVTPIPVAGRRRIAAYDVIAIMLHDNQRQNPHQQKLNAMAVWDTHVAPTFSDGSSSDDPIFHFDFAVKQPHQPQPQPLQRAKNEPVLSLKQAFQTLLRLPTTPRIELHRKAAAEAMLRFFADLEPSVAQATNSPACASLLSSSSSRYHHHHTNHDDDDDHDDNDNDAQLRTRLADAETALLILRQQGDPNFNNRRRAKKKAKQQQH